MADTTKERNKTKLEFGNMKFRVNDDPNYKYTPPSVIDMKDLSGVVKTECVFEDGNIHDLKAAKNKLYEMSITFPDGCTLHFNGIVDDVLSLVEDEVEITIRPVV